jgi:hypothetical protein
MGSYKPKSINKFWIIFFCIINFETRRVSLSSLLIRSFSSLPRVSFQVVNFTCSLWFYFIFFLFPAFVLSVNFVCSQWILLVDSDFRLFLHICFCEFMLHPWFSIIIKSILDILGSMINQCMHVVVIIVSIELN